MPQLFSRAANSWLRLALWSTVVAVAGIVVILLSVMRSPYATGQNVKIEQPVPFSHQHHVADAGIDCRYCHAGVETSAFAGIPSTQVCMNCHRYLWTDAPALELVRTSWREEQPMHWNRVHDLPDYVFFNHAIHVHKGIGCYSCHGRIHEMPLTRQDQPLTMQWCLDCHRDPERHVRPRSLIYHTRPLEELQQTDDYRSAVRTLVQPTEFGDNAAATEAIDAVVDPDAAASAAAQLPLAAVRRAYADQYGVRKQTDCYTCHR